MKNATRPIRISEPSYRYLKQRMAMTDESMTAILDKAVGQLAAEAAQRRDLLTPQCRQKESIPRLTGTTSRRR